MFCNKCGKQIKEGSNFCEYCGAAVGEMGNVQQTPDGDSTKRNTTHATPDSVWAAIQETNQTIKDLAEDTKRLRAERDEDNKRLKISLRNMYKEIGGIGKSNGGFAEEYFFNSLKNNMELFGEKFDSIEKNVPAGTDESNLDSEFDIVYYNCKSVAIVEVKYRAQFFHVLDTFDKVDSFRNNYPEYANHRIYLALAAMFFDDEVESECTHEGIAVIKQEGGNVVINDKNLKVF
jgi:hypothetical protein